MFGLGWLVKAKCRHEFAIEDLRMVNPESEGDDRVEWPCEKCGKVFRAQCGLDISPKYGFMHRRTTLTASAQEQPHD